MSLEAGRDILKQAGIPGGRPIIGISVRNWLDADRWTERFGRYLEKLKEEKVTVLFIPMQWPEDNRMAEKICQRGPECFHFLEGTFSAPELMSIIGNLDLLVGMRLHALIFAALMHIPMIGISYDRKLIIS